MQNEHATRIKSAAIMLAVIFLVGVIDNLFLTWLFFGVVLFFAIKEASNLLKVESKLGLIAGALLWLATPFFANSINLIFLALMIFGAKLAYDKQINKRFFLILLYPIASFIFIWQLYTTYGMQMLFALLIIIALTDVGAYYTGKNFGKTPFSPTSPKKTVEGVVGGIVLATIIGSFFIPKLGFFASILVAALTSVAGVFGDLFESYLKREANVKDSGNLIPGHGGILDRIDGYLFGAPMLFIVMSL